MTLHSRVWGQLIFQNLRRHMQPHVMMQTSVPITGKPKVLPQRSQVATQTNPQYHIQTPTHHQHTCSTPPQHQQMFHMKNAPWLKQKVRGQKSDQMSKLWMIQSMSRPMQWGRIDRALSGPSLSQGVSRSAATWPCRPLPSVCRRCSSRTPSPGTISVICRWNNLNQQDQVWKDSCGEDFQSHVDSRAKVGPLVHPTLCPEHQVRSANVHLLRGEEDREMRAHRRQDADHQCHGAEQSCLAEPPMWSSAQGEGLECPDRPDPSGGDPCDNVGLRRSKIRNSSKCCRKWNRPCPPTPGSTWRPAWPVWRMPWLASSTTSSRTPRLWSPSSACHLSAPAMLCSETLVI